MKLQKLSAGNYEFKNQNGIEGYITKLHIPGYVGMWRVEIDSINYSDPVWSYKDAKEIAKEWN
jgi:hypothetical protein